jgi:PAS domain S-box-containing protein
VVFANTAFAAMCGYSSEELVSGEQPARMLSPSDDSPTSVAKLLESLDATDVGRSVELRLVARSGAIRYVETLANRGDFRGRPALQIVFVDVTERKMLEIEGRDEAEVARILTRIQQELIAVFDTPALLQRLCQMTTEALDCDSSHTYVWRPEARRFELIASHGEEPDEVELRRAVEVPEAPISSLIERLERETVVDLTMDEVPWPLTLRNGADGTAGFAVCLALRCRDAMVGFQLAIDRRQGRLSPLRSRIAHGIAQLASMALENARLMQKLELANGIKAEFVSTMSHEFRTPLNAIMGYTSLLLEGTFGDLTKEQTETLKHVGENSEDLLSLVESILDLSRLEKHRLDFEASEIAIEELMADVARETRRLQSKSGLEFIWRVEPDVPPLRSDVTKIKVALKSLIGNAAKFTSSGTVEVHAGSRDRGIEFCVADTGIGISNDILPIIFEPFRQGDGSMSRPYGGAGLGLFLVSRVMDALGGRVSVESEPGAGSRFTLWIPCEDSPVLAG